MARNEKFRTQRGELPENMLGRTAQEYGACR
jgi:hypothetical protein